MLTIDLVNSSDEEPSELPPPQPQRTNQGLSQLLNGSNTAPAAGGRRSRQTSAAAATAQGTQSNTKAAAAGSPGVSCPPPRQQPAQAGARRSTRAAAKPAGMKHAAMAPLTLSQSSASEGPTPPPKRQRPAAGSKGTQRAPLLLKGFGPLDLFMKQGPAAAGVGGVDAAGSSGVLDSQSAPAAAVGLEQEAAAASEEAVLWVDKHCPSSLADLVVHKKKVEEVTAWLDRYLAAAAALKAGRSRAWLPQVLLVTGPPGCGKSTTVRLLAEERGLEVVEWAAPTPTTWDEYKYQAASGLKYVSKLEAFDMFAVRCKFATLPLHTAAAAGGASGRGGDNGQPASSSQAGPSSSQPTTQQHQQHSQQTQRHSEHSQHTQQQPRAVLHGKLVLLDDLPYAADPQRRQQLADSIRDLAASARCPVVVVSTDIGAGGASGGPRGPQGGGSGTTSSSRGLPKDVLAALMAQGATTITFNPMPPTAMTKALQTICTREGLNLSPTTLAALVTAAGGDMRNAVQALQVHCSATCSARAAGRAAAAVQAKGKAKGSKRATKRGAAAGADQQHLEHLGSSAARDQQLGVFHALGKLLHNKRAPSAALQEEDGQRSTITAAAAAGQQVDPEADADWMDLSQQQQQQGGALQGILAGGSSSGSSRLQLHPRHRRLALQYDPEAVLAASGLDAVSSISFLSSNYLNFVGEEMDEAAAVAGYLSSAGFMGCHRASHLTTSGFWDEEDTLSNSVLQAAAASVGARGLLYANAHPVPSRWTPVVGPSCNLPERAAADNLQKVAEVGAAARQALGGAAAEVCCDGSRAWCSQTLPLLRVLAGVPQYAWVQQLVPAKWTAVWQGSLCERVMHQGSSGAAAAVPLAVQAAAGAAEGEAEETISDCD